MESTSLESRLKTHAITSAEQAPEIFDQLLTLSREVFNPGTGRTPEDDQPSEQKLATWKSMIAMPQSCILYATDTASTTPERPLGLFFTIPRTQPEIGHELLHLWIAAVDPASRGLGVFPLLSESAKQHARDCGYSEMTVCTYPKEYEKMYRILGANGWELVAWPIKDVKVLMKFHL